MPMRSFPVGAISERKDGKIMSPTCCSSNTAGDGTQDREDVKGKGVENRGIWERQESHRGTSRVWSAARARDSHSKLAVARLVPLASPAERWTKLELDKLAFTILVTATTPNIALIAVWRSTGRRCRHPLFCGASPLSPRRTSHP